MIILEALMASVIGFMIIILVYMHCHRNLYTWRDFSIIGVLLLHSLFRWALGMPPTSHLIGMLSLNALSIFIAILVWLRPSRIPTIELESKCKLERYLCNLVRRKHVSNN